MHEIHQDTLPGTAPARRGHTRRNSPALRWHRFVHTVVLGMGLLLALLLRVHDVADVFTGLLPVREFRAALIARDQYYAMGGEATDWERQVARTSREREWSLEPPVMETLSAAAYRVAGGEHLWLPRLMAALFFFGSTLFFWKIARHLFDRSTAVFLTVYYLFFPVGVLASRSFQPDTLMLLLYLASLWALLRYDRSPGLRGVLAFAVTAAAAIFLRPLCVFAIGGAFAGLAAFRWREGQRRPLTHLVIIAGAVALGMSYYLFGLLFGERLSGQAEITFRPHLLGMQEYWRGWLTTGLDTITVAWLAAALTGLMFVRSPRTRWLLGGLWLSYIAFGLIFNYHIATHNYYHLQVVPTVALSAGALLALLLRRARRLRAPRFATACLYGLLALFVLHSGWRLTRPNPAAHRIEKTELAAAVGEAVQHSTRVVYLAPFYGRPLEYFGRLSGTYWPRPTTRGIYDPDGTVDESIENRLAALPFTPEYFVVTDFREYERHHTDLAQWLTTRCDRLGDDERYLVFGHCRLDTAAPTGPFS